MLISGENSVGRFVFVVVHACDSRTSQMKVSRARFDSPQYSINKHSYAPVASSKSSE